MTVSQGQCNLRATYPGKTMTQHPKARTHYN